MGKAGGKTKSLVFFKIITNMLLMLLE